jgi:hypothetical protein
MSYTVRIDATAIADRLHDIESGNPKRSYKTHTLTHAVQIANAFAFGAGLAMRARPRSIKPGDVHLMCWKDGEPGIAIERSAK